jgi:hypothetical protein
MRRLGPLLCLALLARAGDDPKAPVTRVYDAADLAHDKLGFAMAIARVKAAARGHAVRVDKSALVVVAPPAVHGKVAEELAAFRAVVGRLVRFEIRLVKAEGGLGVASVPADRIDALLQERKAETVAGPTLVCFNGQQARVTITRQISYVGDFDFDVDEQGNVTADPVISTLEDGIVANLRPFVSGQVVRVALDVSVTEVAEAMQEVELPVPGAAPLKVQVPERTTRSVARLLECADGTFTAIDLGGGRTVLLKVAAEPAEAIGTFPGQDVPLGEETEVK